MKIDLAGKVAVVTGGANGIGRAIVRALLVNGAKVVFADINEEAGRRSLQEFVKTGECRFVRTDVSDRASVDDLVRAAVEAYGRIDVFVNNAGINLPSAARTNVDGFTDESWRRILEVDLTGVFYGSRAAARVMLKQGSGRIINIGSVFGAVPARKQIAFVAAKAGVHNMTRGMALELAPNILVNAIAPGSILTEGTKELFYGADPAKAELAKRLLSHVPLGRPGDVEDIANAVLFLSGEESRYITGHVLIVDGGWTCGYTRDF